MNALDFYVLRCDENSEHKTWMFRNIYELFSEYVGVLMVTKLIMINTLSNQTEN